MKHICRTMLIVTNIATSSFTFAQESTFEKNLNTAQSRFNAGDYADAIARAPKDTLLSRQDRQRLFQLLAMVYVELKEPEKVKENICKLVHNNPLYRPSDLVQHDFLMVFSEYEVSSIFSLRLNAGVGRSFINLQQTNDTYTGEGFSTSMSGNGTTALELLAGYHINKNLSLHAGVGMSTFQYDKVAYFPEDYTTEFSEKLNYISIPLVVRVKPWKDFGRFSTVIYGGVTGLVLQRARADINIYNLVAESISDNLVYNKPTTLTNIPTTAYRNDFVAALTAGIDVGYTWKRSTAGLGLRYEYGLKNIIGGQGLTIANDDVAFYYYHNDAYFKLNNILVYVSFSRVIKYRIKPKGKC